MRSPWILSLQILATLATPALAAQQGDPPDLGWSGQAELSAVATSGNSAGWTFGFKGLLARTWELSSWSLRAGGLGAQSTIVERSAEQMGDGSIRILEKSMNKRTAESYSLRTGYNRKVATSWSWILGLGWERNEFAGLANRWNGLSGIERIWYDSETARLTTNAGLTLTRQDPVVADPDQDDTFVGARLAWDYRRRLTATTKLTSELALDLNLEETRDVRIDTTHAIAVSISERLALKVGLQLLYDAKPALVALPVTQNGEPTGQVALFELDEIDSLFTAALVFTL